MIRSYQGQYRHLDLFQAIRRELSDEIPEALAKIEERLGLRDLEGFRCHIRFHDRIETRGEHEGRIRALRTTRRDADGYLHEIGINLEYIFQGVASFREEILHELTHAVMLEDLGAARYNEIPRWYREGVAVFLADQGKKRFEEILAQTADPLKTFDGLEATIHEPHTYADYAEDYQAIAWMLATQGNDLLARVQKELKSGTEFIHLFPRLLGMNFSTFNERFRAHFRSLLPKLYDRDHLEKKVKEVFALSREPSPQKAIALGETLLKTELPESRRDLLGYLLGKAHFEAGNYQRAILHLDPLLGLYPRGDQLRQEMEWLTASAFFEIGIFSEAIAKARALLADPTPHPYCEKADALCRRIDEKLKTGSHHWE